MPLVQLIKQSTSKPKFKGSNPFLNQEREKVRMCLDILASKLIDPAPSNPKFKGSNPHWHREREEGKKCLSDPRGVDRTSN